MNGKGSKPRNCFSKNFKDNYSQINWGKYFCSVCEKLKDFSEFYSLNQIKKTGLCKECEKGL